MYNGVFDFCVLCVYMCLGAIFKVLHIMIFCRVVLLFFLLSSSVDVFETIIGLYVVSLECGNLELLCNG